MEPPGNKEEGSRLFSVYETWRQTRRDLMKFSLQRASQLPELRMVVAALLAFLLIPIDANLWGIQHTTFAFEALGLLPRTGLWAFILAAALINGWSLDGFLSGKTSNEKIFRSELLFIRPILCSIPIFNFLVLPAWQWLTIHHPPWALRRSYQHPRLALKASALLPRTFRPSSPPRLLIAFFVACNGASFVILCHLYSNLHMTMLLQKSILIVSAILFHSASFVCNSLALRAEVRFIGLPRGKLLALFSLSCLWLVPLPWLPISAFLVQALASSVLMPDNTLVRHSLSQSVDRLPTWSALSRTLRHLWGHLSWRKRWNKPPEVPSEEAKAGKATSRSLLLYDLKSFFLFPDITALVIILLPDPGHDPYGEVIVKGSFCLALAAAVLCLLTGVALTLLCVARAFRHSAESLSFDQTQNRYEYLVTVPSLFVVGLWSALLIRSGHQALLKEFLIFIGPFFLWLQIPDFLFGNRWLRGTFPNRGSADILLRFFLFQITVLPTSAIATASLLDKARVMALSWLTVSLVLSLLSGWRLLPWLQRPFRWSDALRGQVPVSIGASMTLIGVTAMLPLGGLAVPLWIVLRRLFWPNPTKKIHSLT
jgi:hypothetical protein